MTIKIFLDSNIILDLFDDKRPFHQYTLSVYTAIESEAVDAYISESVLISADLILKKVTTKEKRFSFWKELLEIVNIIPCSTEMSLMALHRNRDNLEDILPCQMAKYAGIDYFISNDKGLARVSDLVLPVISSKEFLNINQ